MGLTLTNNDILRRLRYTFNFHDKKMIAIFALAGAAVTREQISQWLKKDTDNDYAACTDVLLATFLNGLIIEKRGKKSGPQPIPEKRLTNNIILTKLKIAFNLQAEDIIDLLSAVDFRLSKPELSAFSRKADHKHYRLCKDQILRNLLQGIDKKYHVARTVKFEESETKRNSSNKAKQGKKTNKPIKNDTSVQGARPSASSIYHNPAVNKQKNTEQAEKKRRILKLN